MRIGTAEKLQVLDKKVEEIHVRLEMFGERLQDFRDDIDYLFRAFGKIQEKEEDAYD